LRLLPDFFRIGEVLETVWCPVQRILLLDSEKFIKALQYSKAGSSLTTATRPVAGRSENRDWIRGVKRGFHLCLEVHSVSTYQIGTWGYFRSGKVDKDGGLPVASRGHFSGITVVYQALEGLSVRLG
jgi:hypothetical protein